MKKNLIVLSKLILSFSLISFFLYQAFNFQEFYLKFSSSPGINENGLEKSFYLIMICEAGIATLIWVNKSNALKILNDILSLIYFPFLIILLYKINDITGGCIPCHVSMFEPLGLNYHIILGGLIFLALLYFFIRKNTFSSTQS